MRLTQMLAANVKCQAGQKKHLIEMWCAPPCLNDSCQPELKQKSESPHTVEDGMTS